MTYLPREIFGTLEDEAPRSYRAAVFGHPTRCNLWSGRQELCTRAGSVSATSTSSAFRKLSLP
jgi:hypothetical protein